MHHHDHLPEPLRQQIAHRTHAHKPLPQHLQHGMEALSGHDLSQVRVHYNSHRPTQLGAVAYSNGNDIYLAPGQERHLPHELAHVVQQKPGHHAPGHHGHKHPGHGGGSHKPGGKPTDHGHKHPGHKHPGHGDGPHKPGGRHDHDGHGRGHGHTKHPHHPHHKAHHLGARAAAVGQSTGG